MSGIAAILRSGPLILMLRFSCPVYSRKLSFEIQKRADGRDRRRSSRRAVAPADCSLSSLNSHPADAEPRSRRRVCRAAAVWGLDWPVRRSELRCRGLATSTPARRSTSLAASSHSSSTCSTAAVFARDPGRARAHVAAPAPATAASCVIYAAAGRPSRQPPTQRPGNADREPGPRCRSQNSDGHASRAARQSTGGRLARRAGAWTTLLMSPALGEGVSIGWPRATRPRQGDRRLREMSPRLWCQRDGQWSLVDFASNSAALTTDGAF